MILTVAGLSMMALLVFMSYRHLGTLAELHRLAEPHLSRRRMAAELSGSDPAWVADVNETTIELKSRLDQPAWVSRRCAKVAFSLGGVLLLVQAAGRLGRVEPGDWVAPALSFVGGCAAALSCSAIGRAAEQRARRLREDWNALIRRSTQDVPT